MATAEKLQHDFKRYETDPSANEYPQLLTELERHGTPVRISHIVEIDEVTAPWAAVQSAFHEYIFPPQPVELIEDTHQTLGSPYESNDKTYRYSERLVAGRVKVYYDASGKRTFLSVAVEGCVCPDVQTALGSLGERLDEAATKERLV